MSTAITAKDVKKLRDITGAGMMDCKKALSESGGDIDEAIEILRKKGQKLSAKRAEREANEGVVYALTSQNHTRGVIIRLSCETDFVAKGDGFIAMAEHIANVALENLPETLDELMDFPFDGDITIREKIVEQVGVIGEKIELRDYQKIDLPAGHGQVVPYIHMGYRAGVIVALNQEGNDLLDCGKNVAMQVAAMKPIAVSQDGVPEEVINKELEIAKELARNEGKPDTMLEKIAQGRLKKFFKETTLLNQVYVRDSKHTIGSYLKSKDPGLTVTSFKHVALN